MTRNAQPKPYSRPSNTDSAHLDSPVEFLRQIASECQHQGPGNPDYAQYKQAEADYALALKPNRRAKALIDHATFEDIWAVLHGLDRRTPQFRFWVRKMFTLGPPPEDLPGLPFHRDSPDLVVLHEGLPIALQEHIYDILCYCHELSGHGGRDRTCAITRSRYSWIPKDLIARFIKHCPTCGTKKGCSINVAFPSPALGVVDQRDYNDELSQLQEKLSHIAEEQAEEASDGPSTSSEDSGLSRRYSTTSSSSNTSTTAVESFPHHTEPPMLWLAATGLAPGVRDRFMAKSESASDTSSLPMSRFSSSTASSSSASSTPMSREVSLYGGLPNGWQYVSEYHDAYNKFAENKLRHLPREAERLARREMQLHPRVPSVAPLGAAIYSDADEDDLVILPPIDEPPKQPSELPGELPELRSLQPTSPQIDPKLMQLHAHNDPDPRFVSFYDRANNAGPAWSDSGCYVVHDPSLDPPDATVHAH